MKERLNLTIDAELVESMKAYAAGKQMSVSELVESYFRSATRPLQRKNIVDLVDELEETPVTTETANWKGSHKQEMRAKYGV
jgi:hypothetical protein